MKTLSQFCASSSVRTRNKKLRHSAGFCFLRDDYWGVADFFVLLVALAETGTASRFILSIMA